MATPGFHFPVCDWIGCPGCRTAPAPDPSAPIPFKALGFGETFEFHRPDPMIARALASGPWRKYAPRSYCLASDKPGHESRYRVGSINVKVIRLGGPSDAS